jgi:hypothetical protein
MQFLFDRFAEAPDQTPLSIAAGVWPGDVIVGTRQERLEEQNVARGSVVVVVGITPRGLFFLMAPPAAPVAVPVTLTSIIEKATIPGSRSQLRRSFTTVPKSPARRAPATTNALLVKFLEIASGMILFVGVDGLSKAILHDLDSLPRSSASAALRSWPSPSDARSAASAPSSPSPRP